MNINFKLRSGKKHSTIIIEFRCGELIRIRVATEHKIPSYSTKYWDINKETLKVPNDIPNSDSIIHSLYNIKLELHNKFSKLHTKNFSYQKCKKILLQVVNPKKLIDESICSSKSILVEKYFIWYLDFYSKNISPHSGKHLSESSIKTYNNSLVYFSNYLKYRKIKNFTFNDISKNFYYDYIDYGQVKGYSLNYIGTAIQKIKTIMKSAYDEEIHDNREFLKPYFKKIKEEVNHPYLTRFEIDKIQSLKIDNEEVDNARDIFIIGCYTGLRVGDLMRFLKNPTIEYFNGRKHIYQMQKKTGNPVLIPVNSTINTILEKRNGKFPQPTYPEFINKKIKIIAERVGINSPFTIVRTVGGVKTKIEYPKYKLVCCHTARRSFCTNAYNSGMPPHDIMIFSGHRSEKVLMTYIKATIHERVKKAGEYEFFN